MSTATTPAHSGLGLTQWRIVRSEWTKLRSLSSSRWSLVAALVLTIGIPCLIAAVTASQWDAMSSYEQRNNHPLDIALAGMIVAQLPVAVLGILAITGEYATGVIRATLCAVPRRLPVLRAKAIVYGGVWFAVMLPAVLVAFFASQAILSRHGILRISLSDPGVARSLLGGVLYLALVAIFGLGLGAIIRNTAATTAVFGGIMFVVPPLLVLLPRGWDNAVSPYLPQRAGSAMYELTRGEHSLAPWPGFAVFGVWAALSLAIGGVLLAKRNT